MGSRTVGALTVVAAVVLGFTVGGVDATSPPTTEPSASIPPSSDATAAGGEATLPSTETSATGSAWEHVVPGGDCACADGSEFNFWVRDGDPDKVVLFLEGGGACFDPTTCAFTAGQSAKYDWNISPDDDPALMSGIFDFSRAENPFADYTFIYVPYCTGDIHLGDLTREYSPELTVEHVGFVNGTAVLDYLAANFADAEQVVVVGESAGAIAAPVYAGLASDLLPDAQITVFADGSGAYHDDPNLNAAIGALWGSFETMPDWEVNEGLTPQDWGIPRFWVQAGLHDPEIIMSRFDFAYDEVQSAFLELTGSDASDLGATMAANEAMIEAAGVVRHSFTAPGTDHTIVRQPEFYDMEVGGVTLSDWVADVVAGADVPDVTCDECGGPAPASTG
jgi:Pectinacetylesterase